MRIRAEIEPGHVGGEPRQSADQRASPHPTVATIPLVLESCASTARLKDGTPALLATVRLRIREQRNYGDDSQSWRCTGRRSTRTFASASPAANERSVARRERCRARA
jgi:hypothetical protein